MRYLLILSLFILNLWANNSGLIVTENDPSSLVEGVSVITGNLYSFDEDYVVQGAEPVRIYRSYLSGEKFSRSNLYYTARFICPVNEFEISEADGTAIAYCPDAGNKVFPVIGKSFFANTGSPLKYNALGQSDKGVTNTKSGEISAKSNLKNQYIIFDPIQDKKGKSFTLHASDGTIRRYVNYVNQSKVKDPFNWQKYYFEYFYKLVSETLPNGHMIHYHWDDKNRIRRIFSSDLSQTKIFASVDLPVLKNKEMLQHIFTGSDLRSIAYNYQKKSKKKQDLFVLSQIQSSDVADQSFDWKIRKKNSAALSSVAYLTRYSLPQKRTIEIEYEGLHPHCKVKTLKAPVGKDATPIVTHSFFYDSAGKSSYVLDVQGNRTSYYWNNDYRLTRINRFIEENLPHSSDLFHWEGILLRSKTFLNEMGSPVFSRTYFYDTWGNVKEEIFSGNLTGESGGEQHIRKRWYSEDGKNLLLQEEGSNNLKVTYSYWNNTHLPHRKLIQEGDKVQIQQVYGYDGDCILRSETTEDGVSKLTKVFTPYIDGPFIGMPKVIEEKYGNGNLLRKTVVYYGPGANIEKKEIYDAYDVLRYTLYMEYDSKGRLLSETNAIGQKALYAYDEVGNRSYEKSFSGKLETFYEYDFSNRLIKKEEKGSDGVHRIYRYEYDTKHNLTAEIDPYGNETRYVLDSFGNRLEIHLPSIISENGTVIHPIIRQKFDSVGNLIEKTDAEGNLTRTKYNAYGKPIKIMHPDGAKEEYRYYLDGNLKTYRDPMGVVTEYTYDYLGRILTKTTANAQEKFEYEGSVLKKKIDPEGNEAIYEYDLAGRKKRESIAGEETSYDYDELGRVCRIQKGDLVTITLYDLLDRVLEERDESISGKLFRKVNYEYDDAGNKKAIIRNIQGKEAREEYRFDSVNRLIEKKDALGFIETWEFNSQINQKTHTDALGLKTVETYNGLNKIASIEKNKNQNVLFREMKFYNQNGEPILQVDTIYSPNSTHREVQTCWEYDSRGQLKMLIEAAGTTDAKITRYTYSPRKELITVTKPNGVILNYRYNDLGHLESLSSSDGTVNHSMKYNLLGHLIQSDALTRKTDAFGRILQETFPAGFSIENAYDTQGRRMACKIPQADCFIEYSYDPAHLRKIARKRLDGAVLYAHNFSEYDLSGNMISEERIDRETTQIAIDLLNRKFAIHSPLFTQEVTEFDPVGNIVQMRRGTSQNLYTYDDLYQLTSEKGQFNHLYAYDSINNRLQKDSEEFRVNPLHQIASHFEYDQNGNPTRYNDTTYTYDALDRLIRLETPKFTQEFTYDSLHRCLSKKTTQSLSETMEYFVYDGQKEIGSFDHGLRPIALRILGHTPHAEIGAAIAIELNDTTYIPIHDLQGNLAILKPLDSAPTYYHYTAFGEEQIEGDILSPWRYSSKRVDSQTQLVYFGRRFYIPAFGRWLTPDPAGFTDGMNLYAYVHNNPLTHLDDYGLWIEKRPPGYFTAPDFWRSGINQFRASTMNTWNHPRFRGSMQAFAGFAEMAVGAPMIGTPLAPIGAALLFHGADHFVAGTHATLTGRPRMTATTHFLQKAGMHPQNAAHWDSSLNCIATIGFGGLAIIKASKEATLLRSLYLPQNVMQAREQILFGQKSVSPLFSEIGHFKSKSIYEVVNGLRNHTISPESMPIEIIVRNGQKITLNNRSLLALRRAGMEPKVIADRTGIREYELLLDDHLRGNLPSDVIRIRGGLPGTSLVGPPK